MDREQMGAALAAWDAARAALAALPLDALSGADLLALYEHRVHADRQDAALDHTVLAHLRSSSGPRRTGTPACATCSVHACIWTLLR